MNKKNEVVQLLKNSEAKEKPNDKEGITIKMDNNIFVATIDAAISASDNHSCFCSVVASETYFEEDEDPDITFAPT